MKITNRTFIVSGGSSGLGLATVEDLLTSDAYIAIFDLRPPKDVELSSSRVRFFQIDITKVEEIEKAVDGAVAWTKETGAVLGGVVNCAGVGVAAKIIDSNNEPHSLELWDFAIAVNLTGSFNLTRLVLKHLVTVPPEESEDGERGIVIFVASSAAFEGQPGQAAYAATKGGVAAMTLPLSRDLARHAIRVLTIAPGAFSSAMTANFPEKTRRSLQGSGGLVYPKRFGWPYEFAKTVRWAVEVPYVNGEVVRLSGAGRLPGKL